MSKGVKGGIIEPLLLSLQSAVVNHDSITILDTESGHILVSHIRLPLTVQIVTIGGGQISAVNLMPKPIV